MYFVKHTIPAIISWSSITSHGIVRGEISLNICNTKLKPI